MRAIVRVVCCLALFTACGGDDDDSGGSNGGQGVNVADEPWDPEMCSPAAQQMGQLPEGCAQPEIDSFFDCLNTACESTLEKCYGAKFRSGAFAGPCKDLIECAVDCKCGDSACVSGCPGATECSACFSDYTCGSQCDLPECAKTPLQAAGIDTSKDCDDLGACCASLTEARQRADCNQVVSLAQMAGPSSNTVCAAQFGVFKLISKAPACQ